MVYVICPSGRFFSKTIALREKCKTKEITCVYLYNILYFTQKDIFVDAEQSGKIAKKSAGFEFHGRISWKRVFSYLCDFSYSHPKNNVPNLASFGAFIEFKSDIIFLIHGSCRAEKILQGSASVSPVNGSLPIQLQS